MRLGENSFTCQREKEDKKASNFALLWVLFQNDITAVKGLTPSCIREEIEPRSWKLHLTLYTVTTRNVMSLALRRAATRALLMTH